jgi:hypothetical protein
MRRFFLIERYAPGSDAGSVAEDARRLTESGDATTRHVGTVLVAAEEVCLSVFEAPDAVTVAAATERAGLRPDRIVEAEWFPGPPG